MPNASCQRRLASSNFQALDKDYGFEGSTAHTVLSIFSNIAEGFGRSTDSDKRDFLNDAKDSCAEFRSQTCIGIRAGFITTEVGAAWIGESNRICVMLTRLMKYLGG